MLTFLRTVSRSGVAALTRPPSVLSPTASASPTLWQLMTACNDKGKGGKPVKPMTSICESGKDQVAKAEEQGDKCEEEKPPEEDPMKCHESQKKFTQVQDECEEDEEGTSCSESESSDSEEEKMPTKECPEDDVKDDEKPPKVASQLCDCAAAAVTKAGKAVEKKEAVDKAGKAVEKKVEEVAKKVVCGASSPCAALKAEKAGKAVEKKVKEVAKKVASGAPGPCVAPKAEQAVKPKVSEHVKCCEVETGKSGAKDDPKAHIEKCKKMMAQKCDKGGQDEGAESECTNELDPKNAPCACVKQALEKCKKEKAAKPKPKPANVKKPTETKKPAKKQPPSDKKEPPKPDKEEPCSKQDKKSEKSDKEDCPKPGKKPDKSDVKSDSSAKKPCPKPAKTGKTCEKPKNPKDYKKKPTVICK